MKSYLMFLVRSLGLMRAFDWLFYQWNWLRFKKKNESFIRQNPGLALPPPYMLYEAYRMDYRDYLEDGRNTAVWIRDMLSAHEDLLNKNLLEWGCGPARIIRHIPELLPGCEIHGSDYNVKTIQWCRNHIKNISFSVNGLQPPLVYESGSFDFVYAISVFTHLSMENHYAWLKEIYRVMKNGGIFLFTTQGDVFRKKLTRAELRLYDSGNLVERSRVIEGHRSFSSFHPPAFIRKLFGHQWIELDFIAGSDHNWGPGQDTWIIKKR